MQKRFELVFEWRGFELHPEIPVGGVELADMFGQERLDGMMGRLREVAEGLGVTFAQVPEILHAQRREAMDWGVTGIPAWFLLPPESAMSEAPASAGPRPVKVVGSQPIEAVENAARMAGAKARSEPVILRQLTASSAKVSPRPIESGEEQP